MDLRQEQRERRQVLVEALRSDKYTQGKGWLRREDEWCCLGVASEIFRELTGKGEWVHDIDNHFTFMLPRAGQASVTQMLQSVCDFFGFLTETGSYQTGSHQGGRLMDDNDAGVPFHKIADTIEAEPNGLVR